MRQRTLKDYFNFVMMELGTAPTALPVRFRLSPAIGTYRHDNLVILISCVALRSLVFESFFLF
jgi:hypothetical protein